MTAAALSRTHLDTDAARACAPQVTEGLEALEAVNEAICDDSGRPLQNIRIRHTIILDDPYPDPAPLLEHIPEDSPQPVYAAVSTALFLPASFLCSNCRMKSHSCA